MLRFVVRAAPFFAALGAFVAFAPSAHAQFRVRTVSNAGTIGTINAAETAFLSQTATISGFSNYSVINFAGGGGGGSISGDNPFPNSLSGTDDFALEAFTSLTFNAAGSYVFRVGSDDGFRLRTGVNADGTGGTIYSEQVNPRGPANTDGAALTQSAGSASNLRLTYFERGGGEEVEFSYSRNGGAFVLVGSTSDITVSPTVGPGFAAPEPGSFALLVSGLFAGVGMMRIRRRRSKNA